MIYLLKSTDNFLEDSLVIWMNVQMDLESQEADINLFPFKTQKKRVNTCFFNKKSIEILFPGDRSMLIYNTLKHPEV